MMKLKIFRIIQIVTRKQIDLLLTIWLWAKEKEHNSMPGGKKK